MKITVSFNLFLSCKVDYAQNVWNTNLTHRRLNKKHEKFEWHNTVVSLWPMTQRDKGTHTDTSNKLVMSTTLWPWQPWWPVAPRCLCSCRAEQYGSFYIWQHRLTTVLLITLPLSSVTSVAPCDLPPPTTHPTHSHQPSPKYSAWPMTKWKSLTWQES